MKGEKKLLKKLEAIFVAEFVKWANEKAETTDQAAGRQEPQKERDAWRRRAQNYRAAAAIASEYLTRPQHRKTRKDTLAKREAAKAAHKAWVMSQREEKERRRLKRSNARKRKPGEPLPKCNFWVVVDKNGVTRSLEAVDRKAAQERCETLGYTLQHIES
ncbi:hypothetical protein AAFN60_01855 [Roseibacillus persicicus]|uniref:hypothetical protein n=1 Tax=Roseibacillus persicicus TaxID=454148 RepID=UPI00398AF3A5